MSTTYAQNAVPPRIAIIGGGPAGLVTLVTLTQRGIPASLYEREPDSSSRAHLGGMLDLHYESGQRALRENGLEGILREYWRSDAEETIIAGKDGVPLFHHAPPYVNPADGDLTTARPEIDRRVLREIMLAAVPADAMKWGYALASIRPLDADSEGGQHELTFANGVVTIADIVIGADGANSRVRPLLSLATPIYHGVIGAEVSLAPAVAALPQNRDIAVGVGNGTCVLAQDGKVIIFQRNGTGRIRAYLIHQNSLDWSLPQDPNEAKRTLIAIFDGWAPWIHRFIEQSDESALYVRAYHGLVVGDRWEHKPGVTIIGDAAHLMSPFAGAGANLAMLDGLELGLLLADAAEKGLGREEREAAVAAFEERMSARAEKYAALTLRNLAMATSHGAPAAVVKAFTEDGSSSDVA